MNAKLVYLELRHAVATLERAWLCSRGGSLEDDLAKVLEAARQVLVKARIDEESSHGENM